MEGKRGNDLQALTEIADNDVLIVDTGEGTRKITYGALCAAVKNTLGIREVVESTNITEPGFLMDGKTASEAFAELYSNSEITGTYAYVGYFHEHTWGSQKYLATAINLPIGFDISLYNFALNNISSSGHISLDVSKFSFYQGVGTKSGQILVTTDDTYINICKEAFAAINYTITRKS